MDKPAVYIETTIAGHLTSRLPKDVIVAGQMLATRHWWTNDRPSFDCFTSGVVLDEAGRGDPIAAAERLRVLAVLPLVDPPIAAVDELASLLLARAALPMKARYDAVHVAIAATTGMAYWLTWNCRHLANATLRAKIEQACRDSGFEPPVICTLHAGGTPGASAMTDDDPIVEEIRQIREQMLAEFGGDMSAYLADMQRRTEELAMVGRVVITRGPRPARPPQLTTRKVG